MKALLLMVLVARPCWLLLLAVMLERWQTFSLSTYLHTRTFRNSFSFCRQTCVCTIHMHTSKAHIFLCRHVSLFALLFVCFHISECQHRDTPNLLPFTSPSPSLYVALALLFAYSLSSMCVFVVVSSLLQLLWLAYFSLKSWH